ncbi:MAG: type-4 uracil-DNA glycosylase [Halobacteriota archaeon]|nr:type-4 uracil-DNA glycosylase [Halobacteriota archaeon]
MEEVERSIRDCKKCSLHQTRTNPVVGAGSIDTNIVFIGEAPGRNEDLRGEPFVGAAGKILEELLTSIGLKREDVYIANILKCRPPDNRNPKKEEILACTPYLDDQIRIIDPGIIATLGNFASNYIMEEFSIPSESIGKIHGRVFEVGNLCSQIVIIPLYHPAAAVYNPNLKYVLKEDFRVLDDILRKQRLI